MAGDVTTGKDLNAKTKIFCKKTKVSTLGRYGLNKNWVKLQNDL